jgi:hypothetical protein
MALRSEIGNHEEHEGHEDADAAFVFFVSFVVLYDPGPGLRQG